MPSIVTTVRQGMDDSTYIRQKVQELGPWFHNISLRGVETAPDHFLGDFPAIKWKRLKNVIPQDITGWSVLDIGCNGGFYSIEMKKRGARRVVGIDSDSAYLAQAKLAADLCDVDVELIEMSVYDVAALKEKFDLVLFMGVLYHLRHPLLALDLLAEHVVRDHLLFQSLQRGSPAIAPLEPDYPFSEESIFNAKGFPLLHFVEASYSHDPTNWWIPNRACVEAMLRSAGFRIMSVPEEDAYYCRLESSLQHNEGAPRWSKP
jgi:tRNA (mo5U34)-methyltransferase